MKISHCAVRSDAVRQWRVKGSRTGSNRLKGEVGRMGQGGGADCVLLPLSASNLQPGAYNVKSAARDRDSGVEVEEVSQHVASIAMMKEKELEQ